MDVIPHAWLNEPNVINTGRPLVFNVNTLDIMQAVSKYQAGFGGEIVGDYGHLEYNEPPANLWLKDIGGVQDQNVHLIEQYWGPGVQPPDNEWVVFQVPDVWPGICKIVESLSDTRRTIERRKFWEAPQDRAYARAVDGYGHGWILIKKPYLARRPGL